MTQELINKLFDTDIGLQVLEMYSTSDDRVFIRRDEAIAHAKGELEANSKPLDNQIIHIWHSTKES